MNQIMHATNTLQLFIYISNRVIPLHVRQCSSRRPNTAYLTSVSCSRRDIYDLQLRILGIRGKLLDSLSRRGIDR